MSGACRRVPPFATRGLLVMVACLGGLGVVGVSHAAEISSPAIFGGVSQAVASCMVLNGGATTLKVTIKLLDESGGLLRQVNCSSVPTGTFCAIGSTAISSGVAYACTATAGSVTNLRGALTIHLDHLGGGNQPIRSAPLR